MDNKIVRFIDLFAGIGGIRLGLEQALIDIGYIPKCVFTSEIKKHAISIIKQNHPNDIITGDITKIDPYSIPDFDILCAGFPCQAFSSAGNRDGFADTRGTLFFNVESIIRAKKPAGFILENVEGLVNHDGGNTLDVIVGNLKNAGYVVSYNVLNAKYFGVPQERKRIYIIGFRGESINNNTPISLDDFPKKTKKLGSILEKGKPTSNSAFIQKLLSLYSTDQLQGKSIKDKRGGNDNIHSWDLEIKGEISSNEKSFLNLLLKERRKKHWATEWGIKWMDGMPLSKEMIETFYKEPNLQEMLDHLTLLGYLKYEYPKKQIETKHVAPNGDEVITTRRVYDDTKCKGYNIVTGKLSFEVSKILSPKSIAPTLVATDITRLFVVDNDGLRTLTLREGLRLFGYPEKFKFDINESDGYDLLGNTVVVPVIKAVASRLINKLYENLCDN